MSDQSTSSYDPTQDTGTGTQTSGGPPVLTGSDDKTQPRNPLGVPYYETDPSTGKPYEDKRRYTAKVPVMPNGPGSFGIEGPGTAPSSGLTEVPPRYFEGDQYLPGTAAPDDVATLQRMMIQAGLLDPTKALLGLWDKSSVDAYSQVLEYANRSGSTWDVALSNMASAGLASPKKGAKRQPLVVDVTNPDNLKAAFSKAVQDTLGQGWSQDKINQMVTAYQQIQTEAQQQRYAMTGFGEATEPGAGGTITAPPSPDVYAAAQARSENPDLAQEHDALGMIDAFSQMVGKWQQPR